MSDEGILRIILGRESGGAIFSVPLIKKPQARGK